MNMHVIRMAALGVSMAVGAGAAQAQQGDLGDEARQGNTGQLNTVQPPAGRDARELDQQRRTEDQATGVTGQNNTRRDTAQPGNRNDPEVVGIIVTKWAMQRAPTLPAGVTPRVLNEEEDMAEALAALTEAALTQGGVDDVVERLVDQDRNRLGQEIGGWLTARDYPSFDRAVERFQAAWRAKYNREFGINDQGGLSGSLVFIEGEIAQPQAVAAHWPVPLISSRGGDAQQAAARMPRDPAKATEAQDGSSNIQAGRNVAVVAIPGVAGMPGMNLSMLQEFPDAWKLDIPNHVTGEVLVSHLVTTINDLTADAAQWPADESQAKSVVMYKLLAAVNGVSRDELQPAGGMQERGMNGGRMNQSDVIRRDIGDGNIENRTMPRNNAGDDVGNR